jgi:hypothetical protein
MTSPISEQTVVQRTGRLLFGVPVLCIALGILACLLSILQRRDENMAYVFGILACALAILVLSHVALGKAASLLGSSWILFGLLPLLFIPFGQLLAWLTLVDKRMKLKRQVQDADAAGARRGGS